MKKFIWVLVIAAVALLFWYSKKLGFFGTATAATTSGSGTTSKSSSTTSSTAAKKTISQTETFPMKYGDRGEAVKQLQAGLNGRYRANLAEDGIYGPLTLQALKDNNFPQTLEFSNWLEIVGAEMYRNLLKDMVK